MPEEAEPQITNEVRADKAKAKSRAERIRSLAGARADLDWEELANDLDRFGHETKPTPPIDMDDILPTDAPCGKGL
jgi:hypothetical protein